MPDNKMYRLCALRGSIKQKYRHPFKKLRRAKYSPHAPGDIVQIDSVHLITDGIKTAIDLKSRFAYSDNSLNAKDFIQKLQQVSPFKIEPIQTDNGLEFGKYFADYVQKQELIHYHNYPKFQKSNAYIERFNRTIQEQFVQCTPHTPGSEDFKNELAHYIICYNTQRVHKGLNYITPMQYILNHPQPQIQICLKSHMC